MHEWTFESMGTTWSVLVDAPVFDEKAKAAIIGYASDFDRRFSRFRRDSEANAFRAAKRGTYAVSPEFAKLLSWGEKLKMLTQGRFDPAIGAFFEERGYGLPREAGSAALEEWALEGERLTIGGPVVFDIGGYGKGYAIDGICEILAERGYEHYLVDGGGDMRGSARSEGSAWNVAIEYPGRPDTAAGALSLKHAALAVSDIFRRRGEGWHHIIDAKEKHSTVGIAGAAAIAKDAVTADAMTSLLFLAQADEHPGLARDFSAHYLVIGMDGAARADRDWPGELF